MYRRGILHYIILLLHNGKVSVKKRIVYVTINHKTGSICSRSFITKYPHQNYQKTVKCTFPSLRNYLYHICDSWLNLCYHITNPKISIQIKSAYALYIIRFLRSEAGKRNNKNSKLAMNGLRRLANVLHSSADLYFCCISCLLGRVVENLP